MRRFGGLSCSIIQSSITRFSPSNRSVLSCGGCGGGARFHSATLINEVRRKVMDPSTANLRQQISKIKDPKASIFDIVEQWEKERNYIVFSQIYLLIKELLSVLVDVLWGKNWSDGTALP